MTTKKQPKPDLRVADHGSIFLLKPVSQAGRNWVAEHIADDAQWFCGSVAVEHRYILPIIDGALSDGLQVSQ